MERKKLTRTKAPMTVEDLEKAVEHLNAADSKREPAAQPRAVEKVAEKAPEKPMYSYNIKLDDLTENRVKAHIARTGQNMKGFFQMAIREYLERHGA